MFESFSREIYKVLKTQLTASRFFHAVGAAEMCRDLAERFGLDPRKAYLAGISHDYARELPENEILKLIRHYDLPQSDLEKKKPVLMHGKVGARLLRERHDLNDEDVLDAVENHTLGRPGWGIYGRILYIADYCEPTRKFISDDFRSMLNGLSLDEMMLRVLIHEHEHRKSLAPITQAMYDEIKRKCL